MKIVFMGTPGFAAPALSAICASGHEVKYVVTQKDKPKDRGNKIKYTPVKEKAISLGIEVLQPERLRDSADTVGKLSEYAPDVIVVAAYGQILPPEVLRLPGLGCVNIHASLLPRWRGADPVRRAIIAGDGVTGITVMFMDEGIDTGDIIKSGETAVGLKTATELTDELSAMGAEMITDALRDMASGVFTRTKQDDRLATYAPMVSKREGKLDFNETPEKLGRIVRGMTAQPGAYAFYGGEAMKIWDVAPTDADNPHKAGTITDVSDRGMEVSAGGKTLVITEIQMPGKKRVKIKEYLKGNKIEKFRVLE